MAANISLDSEVLFINFVRACMAGAIMAATSLSPIRYVQPTLFRHGINFHS